MAQTLSSLVDANMQQVRDGVLPVLFENQDFVVGKILKAVESFPVTKTNEGNDFRAPYIGQPAGSFGSYNPGGGALGLGTPFSVNQFTQGYFAHRMAFELNDDAMKGTKNNDLSKINAFKYTMKTGIPNAQRMADVSWHADSGTNGVIGIGTAYSGGVYTLDSNYGADLLINGMSVEIFDTTLATQRTASLTPDSLPTIQVDKIAKTATLSSVTGLGTPAATDKLLFAGCGATPTWSLGLQAVNNNATSGSYLGVTRSTNPEIVANGVNVGGVPVPANFLLLKHRIFKRRGNLPKDVKGLFNVAQQAAILNQGLAVSEWMRGKADKMIDLLPQVEDMTMVAGVPHMLDGHESNSRVDWIIPSLWGAVFLDNKTPDFYEDPTTGQRFFKRYATNGSPAAATLFYISWIMNWYNVDPGAAGFLYNCTVGAGY